MRRSMLATRGRAVPAPRLAPGMRPRRPRRLRGGAAGRAAVAAAFIGLVVAWPRLAPPAPRLPSDRGAPVAPVRRAVAGGTGARRAEAERGRVQEAKRAARRRGEGRRGEGTRGGAAAPRRGPTPRGGAAQGGGAAPRGGG